MTLKKKCKSQKYTNNSSAPTASNDVDGTTLSFGGTNIF